MNANQIIIEDHQSDDPENRFVYFPEIPTLQEISSHQIALTIRYNDHSRRFFNPKDVIYLNLHKREIQRYKLEVESLITTSEIKQIIKTRVDKIEEELHTWLNHFNHILYDLSRHPYKVCPVDINWCFWLPNGEIDYFKTAMKMVRSEELSEIQKFLILCEYCMEDEIKKVSLDTLPTDYIANTKYHDDGILFYWICFLKNTLDKVPLQNHASAETAMARNFPRYTRFAVEHFWHRIGEEDQFIVVSELIVNRCNNHFDCAVVERLISAMSWHQQRRLLAQKSFRILINFSLYSHSTRCALWAWKYCKEEMLEDQFARIVEIMLKRWKGRRHSCPALIEIWETANDNQRNFVIRLKSNKIIDMCLFKHNNAGNALEFVIRFLQQMPPTDRKMMIFKQTYKIRSSLFDLSTLSKIIDVCLPCSEDKSIFINLVVDSNCMKTQLLNYMYAREFKKLNDVLEYYYQDTERARAFKVKLLRSMKFEESDSIIFISNVDEWNKLGDFIDEIFSTDSLQSLKEKRRLIELAITSHRDRCLFNPRRDIHEKLKIIVEMVFAREELKNIKGLLAYCFGESLKTSDYWENSGKVSDKMYFQRIIDWCLGNDKEAILQFKEQAPHDAVFDTVIYAISELHILPRVGVDFLEGVLEHLNKYLKWYLVNDDQVRSFKLSRLKICLKNLEIYKSSSDEKNDSMLKILLKWFFDGDDERIRKFKAKNSRYRRVFRVFRKC